MTNLNNGEKAIVKVLSTIATLSKKEYEQLSADEYNKLFGQWKLKELRMLYRMYNDLEGVGK